MADDERITQRLSLAYGNAVLTNPDVDWKDVALAAIREAEQAAELAERERCAKILEAEAGQWDEDVMDDPRAVLLRLVAAIRRGK